jgi:hypothetical protein
MDACIWAGAARPLRQAGHDVSLVADWDQDPGDVEILRRAVNDRRVVVTADKDFGALTVLHGLRVRPLRRGPGRVRPVPGTGNWRLRAACAGPRRAPLARGRPPCKGVWLPVPPPCPNHSLKSAPPQRPNFCRRPYRVRAPGSQQGYGTRSTLDPNPRGRFELMRVRDGVSH